MRASFRAVAGIAALALGLLTAGPSPAAVATSPVLAAERGSAAAPGSAVAAEPGQGTNYAFDDPFSAQRTAWWREAQFGMFIHFGAYSYWGGEYRKKNGTICQDAEWIVNKCKIPWTEYEAAAAKFNPAGFDGNAIAKLAKDAGQRYIVITAKHHDGYSMWPTKQNTWNLRDHSAFDPKRDILAELKAGADANGVKFGLYYSILDWHHPDATNNFPKYKQEMYAQLKELVTTYHPAVLWFDGHWAPHWTYAEAEELNTFLRGLDRNLVINNRIGKRRIVDGDYHTPERVIPAEPIEGAPWESCLTTNDHWGWARYDAKWKPASEHVRNVLDIASRGGNYLLNVGPDDNGVVPAGAQSSLRGVGDWIRADGHDNAVYGTDVARLVTAPAWGAVTRRGNRLYAAVYDWPQAGTALHLSAAAPFAIRGARVLGSAAPVTWAAAGDGFDLTPSRGATSPIATVIELTIDTPAAATGTGTGLTGQYWTNPTFDGEPALTRRDHTLNFAWRAQGSPAASIPVDNFAARWTGWVQPQYTAPHTFLTVSDETVKVWVDGKVVIDNTKNHGATVDRAVVDLETGRKYAIRVDYTDVTGEAYLKLLWSNPYQRQRTVPASQLYTQ